MSELLKEIKQSEKYPDETTSFILGNCFDEKETAEIVHRCACHDGLVAICEGAGKMLNLCAKAFLDTGEPPEPNEMAQVICDMKAALAEAKKEP